VTHDFRDAAVLADRAAVMVDGRLRQEAPIAGLVESPADAFVASFTGASVLAGTAGAGRIELDGGGSLDAGAAADGRVAVVVHPWEVELRRERPAAQPGRAALERRVDAVTPEEGRARVRLGDLVAEAQPSLGVSVGDTLWALFPVTGSRVLPERRA
jgi:ABC-type Fe3+/spermidine/putrescine transport system ATPase subunit